MPYVRNCCESPIFAVMKFWTVQLPFRASSRSLELVSFNLPINMNVTFYPVSTETPPLWLLLTTYLVPDCTVFRNVNRIRFTSVRFIQRVTYWVLSDREGITWKLWWPIIAEATESKDMFCHPWLFPLNIFFCLCLPLRSCIRSVPVRVNGWMCEWVNERTNSCMFVFWVSSMCASCKVCDC